MKRNEAVKPRRRKPSSGVSVRHIVWGAALALVAAGVIASLDDIRRYMRIRSM